MIDYIQMIKDAQMWPESYFETIKKKGMLFYDKTNQMLAQSILNTVYELEAHLYPEKVMKIFEFNFFHENGQKIDSFIDVCSSEQAKIYADNHFKGLNSVNEKIVSYSFTEKNHMTSEQFSDVLDGEFITNHMGELSYEQKNEIVYERPEWFVGPISLNSWKDELDPLKCESMTDFPVILMVDENNFIVNVFDGQMRLSVAKANDVGYIDAVYCFV